MAAKHSTDLGQSASLEIGLPKQTAIHRALQWLFNLFLRLLAIAFFGLTLLIWLRIVGYWDGPNSRFDTMSTNWKIYVAVLGVLYPVTCVGLWSTLSWGRVVWFAAIAVHITADQLYGINPGYALWMLYFHLASLGLYIIFLLLLRLTTKKA